MYITEPSQQLLYTRNMTQLRKNTSTYEVFYHEPQADQMWKSFFPLSSGEDLGPKILRREPLPELPELMSICLGDDVPQNAIGLGIEFSADTEKWPELFTLLEEHSSTYNSRQIRRFLKSLAVEKLKDKHQHENEDPAPLTKEELKKLIWRSRKLKIKSFFF